jgi:hypothetical protein
MLVAFEWEQSDPPPGGRVSVVVRMTHAEAAALIAATTDSATTPSAADSRAIARPIGLALQAAVADGSLVLP